jgi:putative ABC transport system permease protein
MRSTDVYRALLCCYPAQFRQEYGGEMVAAFSDQLRDARRDHGTRAVAVVWAGALVDLVPTALSEHLHVIRQDVRHAVRILSAAPGFTSVAVLSLALGIGANTAIFSLLNSVLMNTLPVRNPHELVILTDPSARGNRSGSQQGARSVATYEEFRQLQEQRTVFVSLMASASVLRRTEARIGGGGLEPIAVRLVSSSYFATLGVPSVLGRTFDPLREPAPGAAPEAVVSHEYWQRRFGGRPDVLGKTLALRGGVVTIVGVAPPTFFGESVGERPDAWIPLAMQAAVIPGRDYLHDETGGLEKMMWLHLFARLAPGVTIERAQAQANVTFARGLAAYYASVGNPDERKSFLDQRLVLRSAATGASALRRTFAEPLFVLLAAAGLVLLIACSNLGNLLLARTTARAREMATRLALGASRGRLIRQLLTESFCLAAAGALIGLFVAGALRAGLLRLVADPTIVLEAPLQIRTVGFVFGLTLLVGMILGLLPALRITRTNVVPVLREGRGNAGSAVWLRVGRLVVVGQLALSLPLLVGAGLLARTLYNLQRVDLGYAVDDVLTVRIDSQTAGYSDPRQTAAFDEILARIRALPSVRAATYSNNGLFHGSDNGDQIAVEGYTPTGSDDRGSYYDAVGPGYFSTLGIPVLRGREITERDRAGGPMVCVINETFAKRFFVGRDPIGLHVTQFYADDRHTYEVVGIVRDSRQTGLRGPIEHRFYMPVTQPATMINAVSFIVRPNGDAAAALADVRRVVEQTEPAMPILRAGRLTAAVDERIAQDRMLAQLSIAFGLVAIVLAAIGLYGVLSYGIARRTNEIGIRKALGARHRTLIAMIARETGWILLIGLAAGLAISAGAARLIASRLYGLSAGDPLTFASATAVLAVAAVLATWLPASRAVRVDPLVALRFEL